jgi:hypothetical protein
MSPAGGSRRRHLLLVAGSGRSGTSLAAGLVGRLGFHIPVPEVTADASNPRGFGEPRWAVDFHTRLLRQLAVSPEDGRPEAWDLVRSAAELPRKREQLATWLTEQLSESDRVVVKDPRLTWFVTLWESVARDLGCEVSVLTMLRHPAESVRSRQLAYGTTSSATTRTASWLNMMLGLEAEVRGTPRAVVSYEDLLSDWRMTLAAAEEPLGLSLVSGRPPEALEAAGELVDTSLRRAAADWSDLGLAPPVQELAERAYAALKGQAAGSVEDQQAQLDTVRDDYAALYTWAADLTRSRVRAARVEERRKSRDGAVAGFVSGEPPTP